jgi:hypothetical protein
VLLLDAFILVLVVYRAGAPGELPFPPPQQSKLSRIIADIKRVMQAVALCSCAVFLTANAYAVQFLC